MFYWIYTFASVISVYLTFYFISKIIRSIMKKKFIYHTDLIGAAIFVVISVAQLFNLCQEIT